MLGLVSVKLLGMGLGLTKVCMSERTEMELEAELVEESEVELAEESGWGMLAQLMATAWAGSSEEETA